MDPQLRPEHCGNGGAVETVENQTAVFHGSHRPLEIASRFPHSHSADDSSLYLNPKSLAPFGRLRSPNNSRKDPSRSHPQGPSNPSKFRLIPHWNRPPLSGSSRVGIKSRFQAHLWIRKCLWLQCVHARVFMPACSCLRDARQRGCVALEAFQNLIDQAIVPTRSLLRC